LRGYYTVCPGGRKVDILQVLPGWRRSNAIRSIGTTRVITRLGGATFAARAAGRADARVLRICTARDNPLITPDRVCRKEMHRGEEP
jgi:hypothetical protein